MTTRGKGVNLEVFHRYAGLSLPRHVSYPMPSWWSAVDAAEAESMWRASLTQRPQNDLSLYVHVPFCEAQCKFCACNRITLPKKSAAALDRTDRYVRALQREIRELGETVGAGRRLRQIHWGGGSPTYLSPELIERLCKTIEETFAIADDAEIAMEVDPRHAPVELLSTLRRLGFTRLSLGVQDFDEQVQEHVRRIQPFDLVRDTVRTIRDLGFTAVNFDLIYGLPYQTMDTVRDTIKRTIELSPDRVAFYHYAQIPGKIATQRGMHHDEMPDSEVKLEMFLMAVRMFEAAGYVFIGLDHFAKPDEALAKSLEDGTLQRNFQGMTTGGDLDLLGIGASSISHLRDVGFVQNTHSVADYVDCMENDESSARKAKFFSLDDRIRQAVMTQLYCTTEILPAAIEERFDLSFGEYFSRELGVMRELERDGLVTVDDDGRVRVSFPLGRVLMRTVAAPFDAYLEPDSYRVGDQHMFSANA